MGCRADRGGSALQAVSDACCLLVRFGLLLLMNLQSTKWQDTVQPLGIQTFDPGTMFHQLLHSAIACDLWVPDTTGSCACPETMKISAVLHSQMPPFLSCVGMCCHHRLTGKLSCTSCCCDHPALHRALMRLSDLPADGV